MRKLLFVIAAVFGLALCAAAQNECTAAGYTAWVYGSVRDSNGVLHQRLCVDSNGDIVLPSGPIATTTNASATLNSAPTSGATINYGSVTTPGGVATEQQISLQNAGTVAITINSITLADTTNFSITTNNCPPTLATSASCTIAVSFTPSSAAAFNSTLTITDTSTNNATITLSLSGTGVAPAAVTLTSLSVSPASPSISSGASQQFNAFWNYSDGSSVQATSGANYVSWVSGTPADATINAAGNATGVAAGSSTITANAGQVYGALNTQNGANGVTSVSLALSPSTIAANSTIIAMIGWGSATGSITSVTDTCGNTYTVRSALVQAGTISQAIYDSENITNACASNTITVAFGASTNIVDLRVFVASGLNGIDVECHNSGSATTTAQCAASATTTQANDFLIASATVTTAVTGTSISGATQYITPSPYKDASQWQALTASGSTPFSATLTSGNFIWNEIAYKTLIANASTTLTVTAAKVSTYTIQNQPPITNVSYSQTMFAKALPADVDSHRWSNNGFGFSGDQIVLHVWPSQLSGGGYTILCGASGVANLPSNCATSMGGGIYYASASDPIYLVKSVAVPPNNASLNPAGKYFHLTNQAQWGGKTGSGGTDQFLLVWDQSSDIDAAPGGRIFTSYYGNGGSPGKLPNCTCTTTSCAASTTSCQISLYYAALGYPGTDTQGYNESPQGWDTLNAASGIMALRNDEWIPNGQISGVTSGTVNHAVFVNTACTANGAAVTFPAVGSGAHQCNGLNGYPTDTERPVIGNLFYIDPGYNCASSAAAWAVPLCVEMQTYGAYITDTGGGNGNNLLSVSRIEEGYAYDTAGVTDPVFAYLRGQSSTCGGQTCLSVSATFEKATIYFFQGMPGLVDTVHGTTHLHIADPCIAKGLAGMSVSSGGCN